jgi:hypothetical protein
MTNDTYTTTTTNNLHEAVLVQIHSFIDRDIYTNDVTAFYEWIHNHTITHQSYPHSFIIEVHSNEYDMSARYTVHIDHEHDNNCLLDIIYYNDASTTNFNIENSSDPNSFHITAIPDDNYETDHTDDPNDYIDDPNDDNNNNNNNDYNHSPCDRIINV